MKIILNFLMVVMIFTLNGAAYAKAPTDYELFELKNHSKSKVNERKRDARQLKGKSVSKGIYNKKIRGMRKNDRVRLTLNDKSLSFRVAKVGRKDQRLAFSAQGLNKQEQLTVAENNGKIVGSLHHDGKLYKIRPGALGKSLITEVLSHELIDHDENYSEDIIGRENAVAIDVAPNDTEARDGSETEYTVIVAYTRQFSIDAGDVGAYMMLLELETNSSYKNSAINASVKITHAYETNYQGSGDFHVDRDYFSDENNAETQELHRLRDEHKADVMIILTGNKGYHSCGVAMEIGADESTAIAFSREHCAAGHYSFGHEIGHLFGARHIIYTDGSTSPFSYGHGYCNLTFDTWRTVMAYRCPYGSGGARIPYWSNPNVSLHDEAMGTRDVENNARVLNERAETIAEFR